MIRTLRVPPATPKPAEGDSLPEEGAPTHAAHTRLAARARVAAFSGATGFIGFEVSGFSG